MTELGYDRRPRAPRHASTSRRGYDRGCCQAAAAAAALCPAAATAPGDPGYVGNIAWMLWQAMSEVQQQ